VLLVDGFDAAGLPPVLGSARFYGHCRRALVDGGVLVANVFSYDPLYPAIRERLRLMFDDRLCNLNGVAGNNRILFAVKAPARPGKTGHAAPATVLHALRMQQRMARLAPWGGGWPSRVLVRLLITWLKSRTMP
jgi:spermidine synthase